MKQYTVRMWVGSSLTYIVVNAANSANALMIARKLYPNARIIGASAMS